MKRKIKKQVAFRFDDNVYENLKKQSEKIDLSMRQIVERLVIEYLDTNKKKVV